MVDSILLEKALELVTGEGFGIVSDNRVWQAKICRSTVMVACDVVVDTDLVVDICTTSNNLEWALTNMRNICPKKGPAKPR